MVRRAAEARLDGLGSPQESWEAALPGAVVVRVVCSAARAGVVASVRSVVSALEPRALAAEARKQVSAEV